MLTAWAGRRKFRTSRHIEEGTMADYKLMPREDQIKILRTAVANALEMADRLELYMAGINLNDALECLKADPQDNDG